MATLSVLVMLLAIATQNALSAPLKQESRLGEETLAEVVFASVSTAASAGLAVGSDQSDSNVLRQLLYSAYDGKSWSNPTVIYESSNPLVTPSIFSLSNQRKIVVWSELQARKTVLMFKQFEQGQWRSEKRLSDIGVENLGASMALDSSQQLHVFWSAHQNDNDDIYHSYFGNGIWSSPERVHPRNAVPDYGAFAELDAEGSLIVSWKSYSPLTRSYQRATKIIVKAGEIGLQKQQLPEEELQLSDIIVPEFLPADALHVIHFPQNRRYRNARINDF